MGITARPCGVIKSRFAKIDNEFRKEAEAHKKVKEKKQKKAKE